MKKIAYVINYITKNGPSNVVLSLIKNLDAAQFKASLITLFPENDPEAVQELERQGVTVYACSSLTRMGCLLGESDEFTQIVQREQFDILHTHGFIPDILSSRLKLPIRRVSTLHNNMFEDYRDSYGKIKGMLYTRIHLAALRKLDLCVCCSRSVYQVMSRYIPHLTYVYNGIPSRTESATVTRQEMHLPEGAWVFLYAGGLNTRKNVEYLVRNFVQCHLSNEYLLILGTGETQAACAEVADDHVQLLGFQKNPTAYMNISDIYVSASKSEGFSISVLEALSCGLGLFLSAIPSHEEVIAVGKSVYLGEIFHQSDFKEQLMKMRTNRAKIDKKTIQALQKAEFSDGVMTKKYEKFYF